MARPALPERLADAAALSGHMDALARRDPRLVDAMARAGTVSLRTAPRGFEGLARIVCGQQLSVSSARAIWGRVQALGATSANAYLGFGTATLRATGLSRAKHETLTGLAQADLAGAVDFAAIEDLNADDAIAALTALRGIGPWTAEIYLLFCTGHPDVFPAGDLALQKAVAHVLDLDARPAPRALKQIAQDWAPHRGAAALLFWRYFSYLKSNGANTGAWDTL